MSDEQPGAKLLPHEEKLPRFMTDETVRAQEAIPSARFLDTPVHGKSKAVHTPLRVVWMPRGSGLFTTVRKCSDGVARVVLYPHVEYRGERSAAVYRMPASEWIARGGKLTPPGTVPPAALPTPSTEATET